MSKSDCFVAMSCFCLKIASVIDSPRLILNDRPVVASCFSRCKKVYIFCTTFLSLSLICN